MINAQNTELNLSEELVELDDAALEDVVGGLIISTSKDGFLLAIDLNSDGVDDVTV